jgi:hypothetical protein
MSSSPQISPETIERLRDEAYVGVCRKAFINELARLEQQRDELDETRPPFGFIGAKKTVEKFEQSKLSVSDSIAQIQNNTLQLQRIEIWVNGRIREGLEQYLAVASADQKVYLQIVGQVDRWSGAVVTFKDHVTAFARDVKGVLKAAHSADQLAPALAALRVTTASLQSTFLRISALKTEVDNLLSSVHLPVSARLPPLAAFRDQAWVDRLTVLGVAKSNRELVLTEVQAREFWANHKEELSNAAEKTRVACRKAGHVALEKYWEQLRAYALQHYVKPRDFREVFGELLTRFEEAEKKRMRATLTQSPFSLAH